jgi:hypothetical protein
MTLTQAIYSAVGKLTQALCQSSLFSPVFTATLQVPIPQVCDLFTPVLRLWLEKEKAQSLPSTTCRRECLICLSGENIQTRHLPNESITKAGDIDRRAQ